MYSNYRGYTNISKDLEGVTLCKLYFLLLGEMHPIGSLISSYKHFYSRAMRCIELAFKWSLILLVSFFCQIGYVYPHSNDQSKS